MGSNRGCFVESMASISGPFEFKMEKQVIDCFDKLKDEFQFNFKLKERQIEIVAAILEGNDVFVNLATNFGKSLTYILPPLLMKEVSLKQHHILNFYELKKKNHIMQCMKTTEIEK